VDTAPPLPDLFRLTTVITAELGLPHHDNYCCEASQYAAFFSKEIQEISGMNKKPALDQISKKFLKPLTSTVGLEKRGLRKNTHPATVVSPENQALLSTRKLLEYSPYC
jgi:hypothetical protein